jgi:hypothetical protein
VVLACLHLSLAAQGYKAVCPISALCTSSLDLEHEFRKLWSVANVSSNSASTYNTKFSKTILQIVEEIQARRHWIGADSIDLDSETDDGSSASDLTAQGKALRLLDYACGTGLVSRVSFSSYIPR